MDTMIIGQATGGRLLAGRIWSVFPVETQNEFLPVGELQNIGRAELRALLRDLSEVTMLKPQASRHIV